MSEKIVKENTIVTKTKYKLFIARYGNNLTLKEKYELLVKDYTEFVEYKNLIKDSENLGGPVLVCWVFGLALTMLFGLISNTLGIGIGTVFFIFGVLMIISGINSSIQSKKFHKKENIFIEKSLGIILCSSKKEGCEDKSFNLLEKYIQYINKEGKEKYKGEIVDLFLHTQDENPTESLSLYKDFVIYSTIEKEECELIWNKVDNTEKLDIINYLYPEFNQKLKDYSNISLPKEIIHENTLTEKLESLKNISETVMSLKNN